MLAFGVLVLPLNFYGRWPWPFAGAPKLCMQTCHDAYCSCGFASYNPNVPCDMADRVFSHPGLGVA